jgi:N-acyl homoserine lactone hydrolase
MQPAYAAAVRRSRKILLGIGCGLVLGSLGLGSTFCAAPLAAPAALTTGLPASSPPHEMELYQLPTGVTRRSAGFAYRGGSLSDKRDFVMTAALVKHPKGDVLIDTGFGRDIDAHFQSMPFAFRAVTSFSKGTPAAEQRREAGYDMKRLRGIILTHAHWDHVSGIPDFAGVPVLVDASEHAFIEGGATLSALVRSFPDVKYEEYKLEGGAYLGFPRSHDLYGDGSIVMVPAPGHTPGSVVVFVTLPSEKRYAFVGDLVWQREGITEREERPWLQRTLADVDAGEVRENILRMAAIHAAFPELVLVPAHDARGFAELPTL